MGKLSMVAGLGAVLFFSQGCASISPPFDSLKGQPIAILRLQNYEPPAAAAPSATVQLPTQIQSWLSGAAALLPAGLIPPGLIPGTTAVAAQSTDQRFHNFRILGYQTITDESQKSEVLDIFGHQGNFDPRAPTCMYAEFGFSFGAPQAQPGVGTDDILVSLSCEQVQAFNFAWPYPSNTAIPASTSKRIVAIAQKAFGI